MLFNGIDLTPYLSVKRVMGRGMVVADVEMKQMSGKHGAYFQRRRRPPRPLAIEADVRANDEFELRTKIDELNGILNVSEPVPIVFPDEPEITYYGVPQASGENGEHTFLHRGVLNVICPDPDKIGNLIVYDKADFVVDKLTVVNNSSVEGKLHITAIFTATATEFKVTNQEGKFVRVVRNFVIGDKLELDFTRRKVILNNIVQMPLLEWKTSEFFDLLKGSNTLTVFPINAVNIEVNYNERWA